MTQSPVETSQKDAVERDFGNKGAIGATDRGPHVMLRGGGYGVVRRVATLQFTVLE